VVEYLRQAGVVEGNRRVEHCEVPGLQMVCDDACLGVPRSAPSLADQFRYEDLPWALRWGALIYACYFIVSFPMVSRLDERPGEAWSVGRTVVESLAAGMLTFILLDLVTACVGAPYR